MSFDVSLGEGKLSSFQLNICQRINQTMFINEGGNQEIQVEMHTNHHFEKVECKILRGDGGWGDNMVWRWGNMGKFPRNFRKFSETLTGISENFPGIPVSNFPGNMILLINDTI